VLVDAELAKIRADILPSLMAAAKCSAPSGGSPLHCAAHDGNVELGRFILNAKLAFTTSIDKYGETPLMDACRLGHTRFAKFLLDEWDADPMAVNTMGCTVLMMSAYEGHMETMQLLVDRCPSLLEREDAWSNTPIFYAVKSGSLAAVRWLVEEGFVDASHRNSDGWSVHTLIDQCHANSTKHAAIKRFLVDADGSAAAEAGAEVRRWANGRTGPEEAGGGRAHQHGMPLLVEESETQVNTIEASSSETSVRRSGAVVQPEGGGRIDTAASSTANLAGRAQGRDLMLERPRRRKRRTRARLNTRNDSDAGSSAQEAVSDEHVASRTTPSNDSSPQSDASMSGSPSSQSAKENVLKLNQARNLLKRAKTTIRRQRKTISRIEESGLCVACWERPRDVLMMPCKHLCLCSVCARRVSACPLCRATTKKKIQIFL
jgi:hypothetical protein